MSAPTFVYTVRAVDGAPIYVGMTGNLIRRMNEHRRTQAWWQNAATVDIHRCATRDLASVVERFRIRTLRPSDNRDRYLPWTGVPADSFAHTFPHEFIGVANLRDYDYAGHILVALDAEARAA